MRGKIKLAKKAIKKAKIHANTGTKKNTIYVVSQNVNANYKSIKTYIQGMRKKMYKIRREKREK